MKRSVRPVSCEKGIRRSGAGEHRRSDFHGNRKPPGHISNSSGGDRDPGADIVQRPPCRAHPVERTVGLKTGHKQIPPSARLRRNGTKGRLIVEIARHDRIAFYIHTDATSAVRQRSPDMRRPKRFPVGTQLEHKCVAISCADQIRHPHHSCPHEFTCDIGVGGVVDSDRIPDHASRGGTTLRPFQGSIGRIFRHESLEHQRVGPVEHGVQAEGGIPLKRSYPVAVASQVHGDSIPSIVIDPSPLLRPKKLSTGIILTEKRVERGRGPARLQDRRTEARLPAEKSGGENVPVGIARNTTRSVFLHAPRPLQPGEGPVTAILRKEDIGKAGIGKTLSTEESSIAVHTQNNRVGARIHRHRCPRIDRRSSPCLHPKESVRLHLCMSDEGGHPQQEKKETLMQTLTEGGSRAATNPFRFHSTSMAKY